MTDLLFTAILASLATAYLLWGFRHLPQEHWQFMAAMPKRTTPENGSWPAVNLTWYGFFSANAYLAAVMLFLLLTGALGMSMTTLGVFTAVLLGICVPAASLVARVVEKKAHTLTVGGAVFVGLVISPVILVTGNHLAGGLGLPGLPPLPTMAALGVAYAFGEGLGRLACLSFGCCYGKPVHAAPRWQQVILGRFAVRYHGETKKIAYASQLSGQAVLPVQGLTSILYVAAGSIGTLLFISGGYQAALLLTVGVTQLWRVISEFLRADFRGAGELTIYQWMSLAALPYTLFTTLALPDVHAASPVIGSGLTMIWNPATLLALQGLWVMIFLLTGRSEVTAARISFHVRTDRI